MRYQDLYQFSLIFFAFIVLFGVGAFVYHELFPEYKIYQDAYQDLEQFRASYTGQSPAPFTKGIKQIVLPDPQNGPEIIDRCISCHVALDLPHFSPTRVATDVNEQPIVDAEGYPLLEPNPDYVWGQLDKKIAELKAKGGAKDLGQAEALASLKTVNVDGRTYDVTKAISMHPLIGTETRPFEYHPLDKYGCTSCHSGNGRSIVARRAHGPVYDGEYEKAYTHPKPQFTEKDGENDPAFASMYNDKPGHGLVFQTTPLLVGPLMQAKCAQCHQPIETGLQSALNKIEFLEGAKQGQVATLAAQIEEDKHALEALSTLERSLLTNGYENTLQSLNQALGDYHLSSREIDALEGQLKFLKEAKGEAEALQAIHRQRGRIVDSDPVKKHVLKEDEAALKRLQTSVEPLALFSQNKAAILRLSTDVDRLMANYSRGKDLFISQACYACHRIAGFSRASVGPELTFAGLSYPWFVKESIVWPQADLPSSTMPNFRFDHEEVADLMTFLMAQVGDTKAVASVDYSLTLKEWEAGAKMPWEKAVPPTAIQNVKQGMLVFASEGCASCHKLQGFESTTGFLPHDKLLAKEWFEEFFPEQISGVILAQHVEEQGNAIDQWIVDGAKKEGMLEEIDQKFPGLIESFYTNFKFASRAKNSEYKNQPDKLAVYKSRLKKVLMAYIQEYGLGRDIAPHLNWSGVYRDSAWLVGHFQNPGAFTARSIMPSMPFDETKFFMLTNMLQTLGSKNRDRLYDIWKVDGFNPPQAFEMLCSSCHGTQRQGNGILSEWIYPIPKNLKNPVFLRGLTRERAIESITYGIKGSPMPPWGEAAIHDGQQPVLTHSQIIQLVDWLYQGLPPALRTEQEEQVEKWKYAPTDAIDEMKKEGNLLQPAPPETESLEQMAASYFEKRSNPVSKAKDQELYYIRERYYTRANLKEGEQFYLVNCAICHGKEGDGTGVRASMMLEAKPRMFTNLPWIRSRDDLRLLRSIKFGVEGTSMVPWGDETSSAKRMQLVMYIRELTRSQLLADDLAEALYQQFDTSIQTIEEGRIPEFTMLESLEKELQDKEETLYLWTVNGQATQQEAGKLYSSIVLLRQQKEQKKALDALYSRLIHLIQEEKKIFFTLGSQMIAANLPEEQNKRFFDMFRTDPLHYSLVEGKLEIEMKETQGRKELLDAILANLTQKIDGLQSQMAVERDKVHSPERVKAIQELMEEQGTYINLRTKLIVELANANKIRQEQLQIFSEINKENDGNRQNILQ